MSQVVNSVLSDMRSAVGDHWDPPALDGLNVEVVADRYKLKQVLLHLVKNAWEAMADQPEKVWSIRVTEGDGMVRISVEDSGPGIALKYRERVFQPFFSTKGKSGSGLGLAIVKKIVEAHGGQVGVESKPGGGTTVSMAWPGSR